MRFLLLSHAEAADHAVMANVAAHLMSGNPDHITYFDRPDVGKPAPLVLPTPVIRTPAAQVFGGPVPSTVGVGALPTASVISTPPAPAIPPPAPLPVPGAVVPSVPAPPVPPVPGDTPATDSAGLPWDARIHASSKTTNKADGRWRQKRETDPAEVVRVEAELRAVMGAPPAALPRASGVFGLAAAMGLGAPPPATFGDLMVWMAPFMPHKLTPDAMLSTLQANGVPNLNTLIHRPDLVPMIYAALLPLTQ